ncbi:MAG: transglutaminase family protein [Devosia sp.]|nr:transglutaminase family protein [Devosia sp.]
MRLSISTTLDYQVTAPTTMILNIEAMAAPQQELVKSEFSVTPFVQADMSEAFENANAYRRLVLPPGNYRIAYRGEVETSPRLASPADIGEVPIARLPFETLPYLYPSRYCQSDRLARFAIREFGKLQTGYQRVTALCNWIYDNVDYLRGASTSETSAYDTFSLRAGVCRDFAHLGITLCRALGIPARFISVYGWQLEPQDFHAVLEAYLGDRWYLFDATRSAPLDGLVRIAVGHDAADAAFSTFYGEAALSRLTIAVSADAVPGAPWTTKAVSVAVQ